MLFWNRFKDHWDQREISREKWGIFASFRCRGDCDGAPVQSQSEPVHLSSNRLTVSNCSVVSLCAQCSDGTFVVCLWQVLWTVSEFGGHFDISRPTQDLALLNPNQFCFINNILVISFNWTLIKLISSPGILLSVITVILTGFQF